MKTQSAVGITCKSYNNEPVHDGEVLVPMLVDDRGYAAAIGADPANYRTHTIAGVSFLMMYVIVPADQFEICMNTYYASLNELLDDRLGPNRDARCLIPQPDGSRKVCPKVYHGNHEPCGTCPHRNEYDRLDRTRVSLDVVDEELLCPLDMAPSAESEAMTSLLFDGLKSYLHHIDPLLEKVVVLGHQGYSKQEILRRLPLKKSQAYTVYNKAEMWTRRFLYE